MSAAQWAEVETELARKPYGRAREVPTVVQEKFALEYTEDGMQALLRRKGYRHIKARLVPSEVDEAKPQEQRAFIAGYGKLKTALGPTDRIYFGAAAHPTHNVHLSYGWTKKGQRGRLRSNSGRKRYNICAAYCPLDQASIDVRGTDNVNGETLQTLIAVIRTRHPEGHSLLFLDNARYHHAKIVRERIATMAVELVACWMTSKTMPMNWRV